MTNNIHALLMTIVPRISKIKAWKKERFAKSVLPLLA